MYHKIAYNRIHKIHSWFFILLLTMGIIFSSCNRESGENLLNKRVVLIYLGADNDLSLEGYDKLSALSKWKGSVNGRLLVYFDAANDVPHLIELEGNGKQKEIKSYEEQNSASGATLNKVLSDVKAHYRAESYGLILFSHASGWLPKGKLSQPQSLKSDILKTSKVDHQATIVKDGKNEMELDDMVSGLPDKSLEFIVFEACFMTGIEVLYELKNKTNYILASSAEILSPGFTPIYEELMHCLFKDQPDLKGFGEHIFEYWNSKQGWEQSLTLSLINTRGLEPLKTFVKSRANQANTIDLTSIQHFDRYSDYRLFFDFQDYYKQLINPMYHQELSLLIDTCVVWKAATTSFMLGFNGFEIKQHSGITTYIPQKGFEGLNNSYRKLKWNKD
ncbi:hypothetical protein CMT37_18490 [Elizabethkingia anophelis]|nr:hypothetical protein [Elizabethkingia anophelis]